LHVSAPAEQSIPAQNQKIQLQLPHHLKDEMMMVEEELSKIESSMVAPDDDMPYESKKDR
jgi:hypothetical protein